MRGGRALAGTRHACQALPSRSPSHGSLACVLWQPAVDAAFVRRSPTTSSCHAPPLAETCCLACALQDGLDAFGLPLGPLHLPGQPGTLEEPPGHRYMYDEDTGLVVTTGRSRPSGARSTHPPVPVPPGSPKAAGSQAHGRARERVCVRMCACV